MKWIYRETKKGYKTDEFYKAPKYDVYECQKCGAEHYVAHGTIPIIPICPVCLCKIDGIYKGEKE